MTLKIQEKIGLIGVGNMGTAILEGLLAKGMIQPAQVWVYDKIREKMIEFAEKTRVNIALTNAELAGQAEVILLAVKPQDLAATAAEMRPAMKDFKLVLSILAGTPVAKLKDALGANVGIVRAMPNLGAKVGESLTAVTGPSPDALALAEAVFSGCGRTVRLEEDQFDLVTALSGSGPAYFFYLMEFMVKEGTARGLKQEDARLLAVQTAVGAALLAAASPEPPSLLRERVTSKGGTTEAALRELEKTFPETFHRAIEAAWQRGRELSR